MHRGIHASDSKRKSESTRQSKRTKGCGRVKTLGGVRSYKFAHTEGKLEFRAHSHEGLTFVLTYNSKSSRIYMVIISVSK